MKMPFYLLLFIFTIIPAVHAFSQTDVLIVSYKPQPAKKGKDGDNRFGMRLFRMAKSGKDAKDGENGVDLKIKIYALPEGNATRLKLFCFVNNTLRDSFLIHPATQQIKFLADGGDGGKGGSGESGLPQEGNKGPTGGGDGGRGGKGGSGGSIEVYFDSSAIAFTKCKCLLYSNEGGEGGDGGNGGYAGTNYSSDPQTGKGSEGEQGRHGPIGPPVVIKSLQTNQVILVKTLY